MEHLFKLKRDEKTVGYLKLAEGWTQFQILGHNDWYYPCDMKWTSAHPFVTKDKNGKDVFAGDLIRGIISDVSSNSLIGKIVANESPLSCWVFKWKFEEKEYLAPAPDLQDIELIEDKDGE